MNTRFVSRVTAATAMLFFCSIMAYAGPFDNHLKISDVEKATGLKGVKSVAKGSATGAGGDLNFATADGNLALMVQIVDKSQYVGFKQYFFKADLNGVGDQAMVGGTVPKSPSNLVVFTKGSRCVALTAFADPASYGKKFMLTVAQLTDLAKTIASRVK